MQKETGFIQHTRELNVAQRMYLKTFIEENTFFGDKEDEWNAPEGIHTSDIIQLYVELKKLE